MAPPAATMAMHSYGGRPVIPTFNAVPPPGQILAATVPLAAPPLPPPLVPPSRSSTEDAAKVQQKKARIGFSESIKDSHKDESKVHLSNPYDIYKRKEEK